MAKIAIDVVLLPDQSMAEMAIARNKQLLSEYPDKIALDQQSCLPHISLCMGIAEEADIPKITDILKSIALQRSPLQLSAESIKVAQPLPEEQFSVFEIKKTDALQSLFETVMKQLRPYLMYDAATANMFVNPLEIEEVSYTWVKGYGEKAR